MRSAILTTLLLIICTSVVNAQTIDAFEFGRISGAAVKLATQLDYLNKKCKGESTPLYLNSTNFVLKQIAGGSSKLVLENSAKVLGITPEKVNQLAIDEADEVLSQSGGCKSKKLQASIQDGIARFGEHQKYLSEVAELMRRNPGRKLFR
jgi:uncharacterized phosphosugar-binding protein